MKSWKTTVAGILAGLCLIFSQVGNALDNDPKTVCDPIVIIAGIGIITGGVAARDNKVTSEQAGAK